MAYDGTLLFDTEIDTQGFAGGLAVLQGQLAALAAEAGQLVTGLLAGVGDGAEGLGLSALGARLAESLAAATTPVAQQGAMMMGALTDEITTGGGAAAAAAGTAATGVTTALAPMAGAGAGVAGQMMAGMLGAINAMAGSLYAKAGEISAGIVGTFKAAFAIRSPSRVMEALFGQVMEGARVGLDGGEAALLRQSGTVAQHVLARFEALADGARAFGSQQAAGMAAGGTTGRPRAGESTAAYSPHLTQYITTPKPLSEAELTREAEGAFRRMAWQIP